MEIRRSRIPRYAQRNRCVKTALRYYEDNHTPAPVAAAAPFAERLAAWQLAAQEALALSNTEGVTEKEFLKLSAANDRKLRGKVKTVHANTHGSRCVIYYVNFMIEQNLMQLAAAQPDFLTITPMERYAFLR